MGIEVGQGHRYTRGLHLYPTYLQWDLSLFHSWGELVNKSGVIF